MFFIKCHFNLHLRPDKKVDSIQKLLKLVMLHIWYKLGYSSDQNFWRILGSSTFMSHEKNFHKTRGGQNSCHERSRWLRNSPIILIGILGSSAFMSHEKNFHKTWSEFLQRKKQMTAKFFNNSNRNSGRKSSWLHTLFSFRS